MSFTKKIIEVHITLMSGSFKDKGNQKIIRGVPISCDIIRPGFPARDEAKISISGILQEDMESLTFLAFRPLNYAQNNKLAVYAGDEESGLSLVFMGDIVTSVPNYNKAPDVSLDIEAMAGYYSGLVAVPPYSFKGSIQAASVLEQICQEAGLTFINEGVTKSVLNPYLKGSPIQKIINLANQYNLNIVLDGESLVLKPNDNDTMKVVASISAESQMIGYPEFTTNGIRVKSEYLPQVRVWSTVEVKSVIKKATGLWNVVSLRHQLGAEYDGAPWQTILECMFPQGY